MEELEIKRLKRNNVLLIVLIFILLLAVGGLSYYTFFVKDKVKDNNNLAYEVDVSKLTEEINYSYLLDEKSKTAEELSPQQILTIMYFSLNNTAESVVNLDDFAENGKNNLRDSKNVEYPDYTLDKGKVYCQKDYVSDITIGDIKNLARGWGYSVEKIENLDNSVMGCLGSSWSYGTNVFDGDTIREKIKKIFGIESDIFNESFYYNTKEDIVNVCGNFQFVYEKNIDKLFINVTGGCTAPGIPWDSVIKEYKENDLYKMDVVNYFVGEDYFNGEAYPKKANIYDIATYKTFTGVKEDETKAVGTITIDSYDDAQNLGSKLEKYKDKLDNYTLTYKKVGDNYQFVSIDYIK